MKKVSLIVVLLAVVLGLAGCGKDDPNVAKLEEVKQTNAALEQRVAKAEGELASVGDRLNKAEIALQQMNERVRDAEAVIDKMTSRMDRVESH
jgi:predicted nuclease with TOPRIM domain